MQKKTRSQDKYVLFRLCFVAYPFLFVIIISIFCMYWLRLYFLNWIKQFTTSAIIPTKACCLSRQFAYLYHFQWCVMQKISLSLSFSVFYAYVNFLLTVRRVQMRMTRESDRTWKKNIHTQNGAHVLALPSSPLVVIYLLIMYIICYMVCGMMWCSVVFASAFRSAPVQFCL